MPFHKVKRMTVEKRVRTTINYRSPEVVWGATAVTVGIDMWSVACVAPFLCGNPFTDEREPAALSRKWVEQLGSPPDLGFPGMKPAVHRTKSGPAPWPPQMAMALGKTGLLLIG